MDTFYTAYTKLLDYKVYYFIKKYTSFPELKNAAPIMECYGMHTDFDKACCIAGINNPQIKENLFKEVEATITKSKVVEISSSDIAKKVIAG
ncbi:MAG: hypothetical protein WCG67_00390 [Ferruginibacter sp.]